MSALKKIETDKAPKAIGPYSQAIVAGNYLFASGQIAINPATEKLVEGGIKEQTTRVLDNLKAVLAAHNIDFSRVVKTTVYLKDMRDFAEMNVIYAARFSSDPKPARETVQVAGLPMGALVEISCIAYLGK
ncbi:RutC family protein [uncultured archaeon]|nr:RutC family protein [uncultured archaeon]